MILTPNAGWIRPVSIVLENDNHPESEVTASQLYRGFEVAPKQAHVNKFYMQQPFWTESKTWVS